MLRNFSGVTDDMRQFFRDRLFAATPGQVRQALSAYFEAASPSGSVAVYSSQEKLEEANQLLEKKLKLEKLSEG